MTFPYRTLWVRYRGLSVAFVITGLLTLVFGLKFILSVYYWHNPEHQAMQIRGWMTLGHVAMMNHVSPEALAAELNLAPGSFHRQTLDQLARDKGITTGALEEQIIMILPALDEDKDLSHE
ncbi:hypothetical protein [Martelella sp. HB161492]|uniref:hypothetical protein n=1 Tax=Martelella sp. HB161492 TaxID=2720726 RepID=UPI00158FA66D|nr:hypothetical protein [Martelella sp. HB161492]